MTSLGPEGFRAATGVSRETLERLSRYAALLEKWSAAINLVSRGTLPDLWRRHMLDSAQLMTYLPPPPEDRPRRLVDLGSGAGFPGLVLAVLDAGEIHLVESDQKKCAFLREAVRVTGARAEIHPIRIEAMPPLAADVVTARGLAPLSQLLAYADRFRGGAASEQATARANGLPNNRPNNGSECSFAPGPVGLFLKGREVQQELTDSQERWNMCFEVFPSRSDPGGRIVRVSGFARKEPRP